jgi:hypothetical protein
MAPKGMMIVKNKKEWRFVLTKGDWRKYLKRAKQEFKAREKAAKKKQQKKPPTAPGWTGTVIDGLGAGNNEPLSGW